MFFTWPWVIESKSISISDRRKLGSDIMPLAAFQLSSLCPFMMRMHSHTVCTCFGGLAKDLREAGCRSDAGRGQDPARTRVPGSVAQPAAPPGRWQCGGERGEPRPHPTWTCAPLWGELLRVLQVITMQAQAPPRLNQQPVQPENLHF